MQKELQTRHCRACGKTMQANTPDGVLGEYCCYKHYQEGIGWPTGGVQMNETKLSEVGSATKGKGWTPE